MASSSIQGLVDLYTSQQNELMYQDSDILMQITSASRKESTLSTNTEKEKEALATAHNNGQIDDTEYSNDKDEIENDFELQLSVINTWEKELEMKKENVETQLQQVQSYVDTYRSALKQNVQKDFKYAQS